MGVALFGAEVMHVEVELSIRVSGEGRTCSELLSQLPALHLLLLLKGRSREQLVASEEVGGGCAQAGRKM